MKTTVAGLALIAGLGAAGASSAGQATGTLTVNATVADACSLQDVTLSFGNVIPANGVLIPVTANVSVTCTLGTTFSVGLGDGQYLSAGARRMRRGSTTDYLRYELYKDLLMTTRFGDTGASDRATGLGLGITATPITIFGAVPNSQSVGSGNYTDTVQITLYY